MSVQPSSANEHPESASKGLEKTFLNGLEVSAFFLFSFFSPDCLSGSEVFSAILLEVTTGHVQVKQDGI